MLSRPDCRPPTNPSQPQQSTVHTAQAPPVCSQHSDFKAKTTQAPYAQTPKTKYSAIERVLQPGRRREEEEGWFYCGHNF